MWSNKRHVIVMGQENFLRCGFFRLVEDECKKKDYLAFYSGANSCFCNNIVANDCSQARLGILCLGCEDFFPHWFCMFLALLQKTSGNVLIYTDSHKLLDRQKKSLLCRVCDLEHILDVSMPVSYLSYIIEHYIERQRSHSQNCRISSREISVIDGFLKGIDTVCHSSWLGIDKKTLYQHRKNCANKLGIRNLKDLLRV